MIPLYKSLFTLCLLLFTWSQAYALAPNIAHVSQSDMFAVFTDNLSGSAPRMIFSDPRREVNHARVSPDGGWVVFTRYNVFNGPYAREIDGYSDTEAIVCAIDGSYCYDAIPPQSGIVAANAAWTSDGTGLIYVSTVTPTHSSGIRQLTISNGENALLLSNPTVLYGDPHENPELGPSKMILTSAQVLGPSNVGPRRVALWDLNPNSALNLLTNWQLGDYDPKLSPDGNTAVAMRKILNGGDGFSGEWHIVKIDVRTKATTDHTPFGTTEAVPEWSADGSLLIFWSFIDLYTLHADGCCKTLVALPHKPGRPPGLQYTMPAFWPHSNSLITYSRSLNAMF